MTRPARKPRILERDFQRAVIELARLNNWRVAHFRPAQNARGEWRTAVAADGKGFPDLVLAHPSRGLLFLELKREGERPTEEQREWLDALTVATTKAHQIGARVVFPSSWAWLESRLMGRTEDGA